MIAADSQFKLLKPMFLQPQDGKWCWLRSRDLYSKPRLKFAQKPALSISVTKSASARFDLYKALLSSCFPGFISLKRRSARSVNLPRTYEFIHLGSSDSSSKLAAYRKTINSELEIYPCTAMNECTSFLAFLKQKFHVMTVDLLTVEYL